MDETTHGKPDLTAPNHSAMIQSAASQSAATGSDASETAPDVPPIGSVSLTDRLLYGISLPERTARSASAIVGGLVGETAARLIPAAFRSSRSYNVFIQQSLDMLVHDVGGVQNSKQAEAETQQDAKLAQKAVGGLLDIAGAATLHLSPMTVLALFNDLAYGSGHYLEKLSEELRREGVIDQSSTIHKASDLIDALKSTTDRASDAMEVPPFSVDGLRQTIAELSSEIAKVDPTCLLPQSEIHSMWAEMEGAASNADTSLWDVSTTMTMFAMNRVNLTTRGALSSVRVAGNMFDEHITDHYAGALAEIQENGLYTTLATASTPYIDAVWQNFDSERETWTVELLSGRMIGKAWDGVRGWWAGSE